MSKIDKQAKEMDALRQRIQRVMAKTPKVPHARRLRRGALSEYKARLRRDTEASQQAREANAHAALKALGRA